MNSRLVAVLAMGWVGAAMPPGDARASSVDGFAPRELMFHGLGTAMTLSSDSVGAIAQDTAGFMWFGTSTGLDRFDGYETRHFATRRNAAVNALTRDSLGRLWVGTNGDGLARRDESTGRFRRAAADLTAAKTGPGTTIRALHRDREGRLWVAVSGAGILALNAADESGQRYRHDPDNPQSLSSDDILAVAEDNVGRVWLGSAAGLDAVDPTTGQFEHFAARLAQALPDAAVRVNALYVDEHAVLWIGMDAALARLDLRTGVLDVLRHREGDPASLPGGRITALLEDDGMRLWVGTSAGLGLLDRRSDQFTTYLHDSADSVSLPDNRVTALYQDRRGALWVGTAGGGVARWSPRTWAFGLRRFADPDCADVRAFAIDGRGLLWVASSGAGVAVVDPVGGAVTRWRHGDSRGGPALPDDSITAMVTDAAARVWLGTLSSGVVRFDPASGATVHVDLPPTAAGMSPRVSTMLRGLHNQIWIGTSNGLVGIDSESDRVQTALPLGRVTALAMEATGTLWIGLEGGGLDAFDPATAKRAHFSHDSRDPASLRDDDVAALHVDGNGSVWVATRGGGVARATGSPFGAAPVRFDLDAAGWNLGAVTIYGIESDTDGSLWVSTDQGLAVLNPTDRSVRRFHRRQGLQDERFNAGAHFRAPDGTLYFGGVNGYNGFDPRRLWPTSQTLPIALTSILKDGAPLTPMPETVHDLALDYRDTALTFKFAALDEGAATDTRYAYRLQGADRQWVDIGTERQAVFRDLAPGSYDLELRAAPADGPWIDSPIRVRIRVIPPWWARWWAYAAYAGGAAIAAVVVRKTRWKKA